MLVSGFFLPFWNLTGTGPPSFDTLYGAGRFVIYNLNPILQGGDSVAAMLAFLVLASILVVGLAGVLGTYPTTSGALGILGMLMLTLGPVLLVPNFSFATDNYGSGYWALWVLAVLNIFVGLAGRGRPRQPLPPAPQVATPPPPVPAPAPS